MAQCVSYSIVFFDSNGEHSGSPKHDQVHDYIRFCNAEKHLTEILSSYGKVKVAVCVCCNNKRDILNKLQQCPNVASIFICTRHHPDCNEENWPTSDRILIKSLFEDPCRWQIEAHTDARNANNQKEVTDYIQHILQQLIQEDIYKPQNSIEESKSFDP
jgi:hypothetical protein